MKASFYPSTSLNELGYSLFQNEFTTVKMKYAVQHTMIFTYGSNSVTLHISGTRFKIYLD